MPSVAILNNKGPFILTCNRHDGGTCKLFIHQCRWKHTLSSKHPDQLCQAVINPRMLRPAKASSYSITYQLFQQKGTFNGIDTCTATRFGNFGLPYNMLLQEAEARSIYNRPDIHAHISNLVDENVMSEVVAASKVEHAKCYSNDFDYEKYYKGATYVSIENSMILQKESLCRDVKALVDDQNKYTK